jgi:hypothetical protein
VLVLYWYDKDFHGNARLDQSSKTALQSAPAGTVESYPEYLESSRFPGENQSLLLRDYLRRKYADRTIDVVVTTADASLEFLLSTAMTSSHLLLERAEALNRKGVNTGISVIFLVFFDETVTYSTAVLAPDEVDCLIVRVFSRRFFCEFAAHQGVRQLGGSLQSE